jgi:hypothetical protein
LTQLERDLFEQYQKQFKEKLAEFNVLHDASLNRLISEFGSMLDKLGNKVYFFFISDN